MKNERLLNAFGQIDESYILEATPKTNNLEMRNQNMKTNKIIPFLHKPAAMAASLALFVCVSGTAVLAAAGVLQGFFGDIFGANGAVVGTSYSQAADEVVLTVINVTDKITVEMAMVYPGQAPYSELEMFGIENYRIVDRDGNVIMEGATTEMAPIVDGKVSVSISADNISEGNYKLIISELVGIKKADQPLVLSGNWECEFTR